MMFLDGYIEAPPTITVFSCPMAANAAGAAPVAASASASPITSARAECFDFIAHLLWSVDASAIPQLAAVQDAGARSLQGPDRGIAARMAGGRCQPGVIAWRTG